MESLKINSLPELFFTTCNREDFGGWYQRRNGAWTHFSREALARDTRSIAIALHNRGVQKGESIGIIAGSSPYWIMADIATQINHARVVPLFPNISSENFNFQCDDSIVSILIVNKMADLETSLKDSLSRFTTIICIDSASALPDNGIFWDDLLTEGYALLQQEERNKWIQTQIESILPDDLFSIIYTSGSTGRPKGAELSHKNMLSQIQSLLDLYTIDQKDTCLTILPVAHVFERMAVYFYTLCGATIYFADSPKNVARIMTEIKPSVMIVVPRILERLFESMTAAAEKARGPKRLLIKNAIKLAKLSDPSKKRNHAMKFYDKLVYSRMRSAIGGNFKLIVSGSSALNKSILRFLLNIGLPVYEGYGLTECSPVVSANCSHDLCIGSVGKPLKHLQVKIGENSEVLVKGDSVFAGYHNMPELNTKIFTEDGFFKTGDQGSIDENGFLSLTGRIKELLKTSTGKYVSPNPIELEISRHPLVEQALVIANDRKFASALIWLNPEGARRLLRISKEDFRMDLALQSLRVRESILRHITRINRKLNHWEKICRWVLIGDELTIESGLLTPTLKIRRKMAEERYADKIEGMYTAPSL